MKARIYKPSKSAMQSGRAITGKWLLEYETFSARRPESLMGWTSSQDTLNQVVLRFDTQDDAIRFAKDKGWAFTLSNAHERKVTPKNYTDNFK